MNYQITLDESSWNQLRDLLSDRKDDAYAYWQKTYNDLDMLSQLANTNEYEELVNIVLCAANEYEKRYQVWTVVDNALEIPENVVVGLECGEYHD